MRLHEAISGAATRLSATWLLPLTSIAAALMFQICLAGPATVDDPYEEMLGNVEQESDYLLLINNLDTILKQPINLLEADREELGRLPWVSPWLADEIISLRRRGELKRIEDLKRISSVDEVLIELLRPFVEVRPPVRRDTPRLEGMLRARVVSQPASGTYRNLKTYLRTQLGYAGWEGGFILEKDRYESMLNDFQSFYLEKAFEARCLGRGRVIGGDFLLASGHGLVFSNPYGYSPSTVDPWRFSQGDFAIKPYTSVEENFGFSGAGLGLSRDNLGLCIAVSSARYDASLDEDGRVKSLGTSGLHVSEHEQEGKQALKEDLLGLAFQVSSAKAEGRSRGQGPIWRAGIDASYSRLNKEFSAERLSWLSTDGNLMGSLDLSLEAHNTIAFAQGAMADGGGRALIGGLAFDRKKTKFLMVGRAYDETYLSLHSRPFTFYSGVAAGERGVLARIGFEPVSSLAVSIGSDLHQKRIADEGISRPSGSESFLDLIYKVGKATLSLREKLLASHDPPEAEGRPTEERRRLRSRLDANYRASSWLSLRLRYENLQASEDEGEGAQSSSSDLLRLDADLRKFRPAEIRAGFYVFTIGQWASRIYQYEPGVPYYPVIEMLKSDGSRWYLVLSYNMKRFGRLAAKYARTEYAGGEDRSGFLIYYSLRT